MGCDRNSHANEPKVIGGESAGLGLPVTFGVDSAWDVLARACDQVCGGGHDLVQAATVGGQDACLHGERHPVVGDEVRRDFSGTDREAVVSADVDRVAGGLDALEWGPGEGARQVPVHEHRFAIRSNDTRGAIQR